MDRSQHTMVTGGLVTQHTMVTGGLVTQHTMVTGGLVTQHTMVTGGLVTDQCGTSISTCTCIDTVHILYEYNKDCKLSHKSQLKDTQIVSMQFPMLCMQLRNA